MNSRQEKQKHYNQGKRDQRRKRPLNPPGTGVGKGAAALIGGCLMGPAGALLGLLVGDSKKEKRNRGAYNKGVKNQKRRQSRR